MKQVVSSVMLCVVAVLGSAPAGAAEVAYPTKPIRIIVGFPPAGAADIFARMVGQKLTDAWAKDQRAITTDITEKTTFVFFEAPLPDSTRYAIAKQASAVQRFIQE